MKFGKEIHEVYRVFVGKDAVFMDFLYRLRPVFAAKFMYNKMKERLNN